MRAVFRALVETVAPSAAALDAAGWAEAECLREVTLAARPRSERAQLALLLGLIEWLPVARLGRRFSRLEPAARARVLDRLSRAPLRLLRAGVWGARTLALLCVYGRPAAWPELGYRPYRRGWDAVRGVAPGPEVA